MIVCSCNLLTDTAIREKLAENDALTRVRDVYAACDAAPKCGGCAASIDRLIREAERARELDILSHRRNAA